MAEAIVVGLDCGGTNSRAIALQGDTVLWQAQSGPANWASTPRQELENNLRHLLNGCPAPARVAVCMAGILTPEAASDAGVLVGAQLGNAPTDTYADFAAAWRACNHPDAVCVIAGTGALVTSRSDDQFFKSGGGGALLGDRGSGFAIGRALLQGWLYRDPDLEGLGSLLAPEFGTIDPGAITQMIYASPSPPTRIAHVAGCALSLMGQLPGPTRARLSTIVREEMGVLAELTHRHRRRYHSEGLPPIFRAGGLWSACAEIVPAFEEALGTTTEVAPFPPVWGAAKLAQDRLA